MLARKVTFKLIELSHRRANKIFSLSSSLYFIATLLSWVTAKQLNTTTWTLWFPKKFRDEIWCVKKCFRPKTKRNQKVSSIDYFSWFPWKALKAFSLVIRLPKLFFGQFRYALTTLKQLETSNFPHWISETFLSSPFMIPNRCLDFRI
jgi:hypothetical protein